MQVTTRVAYICDKAGRIAARAHRRQRTREKTAADSDRGSVRRGGHASLPWHRRGSGGRAHRAHAAERLDQCPFGTSKAAVAKVSGQIFAAIARRLDAMTGPGTVLWSLVCGSARCRSRWSAAWTWWHMCVRQRGAATRPVRDGPRSGRGHTWRLSAARPS